MTHTRTSKRTGAFALAFAVAASALTGVSAPALAVDEEPAWRSLVDVAPDYLVDTYDLPEDHVFETVTFERFEWLLNGVYEDEETDVTGTFAFLVGGAYDESITSTVRYIDEVAKDFGVETIYTFDPALDGDTLNIFDPSEAGLNAAGTAEFQELGDRLHSYLNQSPDVAFDGTSDDPYLFIYDKDDPADRIVASLNDRKTEADLGTPAAVDAYKAQVAAVFDTVADADDEAQLDAIDEWTFTKNETNRRHREQNPNAETHGHTIIEEEDGDEGWRLEALTYPELLHLVQQEGNYAILLGGTWCPNSRAVVKQINQQAQEHGVEKVYVFDNSLDSTGRTNLKHIRDNPAADEAGVPGRPSHLYGDLWNTHFPNIVSQYRISESEDWAGSVLPVEFHPGGDHTQPVQLARRGQVPFLFHYDKDNLSGDEPAPVISQWIRTNGSGTTPESGWTEYMTQWPHTPASGPISGNDNQQAFAAEAEAALVTFFAGLPGASEVTTTLDVAGSAAPGTATLTATVRHDGNVAIFADGAVEFFRAGDSATSLGTADVADGVASLTLTGLPAGALPFYGVYTPAEDSVYLGSTSSTATVTVPEADEEEPPPPPPAPTFRDIAGSPHEANINRVASLGIALGTSSTTFNPGGNVTRAQTASFVARTLTVAGVELPSNPQSTFPDVLDGPHALAIRQLADLEVILGNTSGRYDPGASVTRAQVASLVVRAIEQVLDDVGGPARSPFTDIAGSPHAANIDAIHGLGIALGRTATTFEPSGQVTRAQTASFLARTLDLFEREGITLTPLS